MRKVVFFFVLVGYSCVTKNLPLTDEFIFSDIQNKILNLFEIGDTLSFINYKDEILSIVVSDTLLEYKNTETIFTRSVNWKQKSVLYKLLSDSTSSSNLDKRKLIEVYYTPDGGYGFTSFFWNDGFSFVSNGDSLENYYENLVLGDRNFSSIYKFDRFETISDSLNSVKYLYFSVNQGLIGYETYDGMLWINKSIKDQD